MSLRARGLRRRVTLASLLLGLCLSLLFGGAMIVVAETYEHILVEEILRGQAEDYSLRLGAHPDLALPRTHRLSGYLLRPGAGSDVPPEFAALPPGIHEAANDEGQHIGVFDTDLGRFWFVIDLSDIERLEQLLALGLVIVLLGGTLVAGWLGWLMAGPTIAPVVRLAAAVDALPVEPQPTALAAEAAEDELGRLAQAIDRYQQRLTDADAAERAFFADASHELRTPVAVVRGAVELLADDAQDDGARRRVQRLERGVDELTDLIDLLLGIVRRRELDAAAPAREILAQAASERPGVQVHLRVDGAPDLPRRETGLLLRAVLRRLVVPGTTGTLELSANAARLEAAYAIDGATQHDEAPPTTRSDRGLGLTLASRLAAKLGWRIEEMPRCVRIHLPSPSLEPEHLPPDGIV